MVNDIDGSRVKFGFMIFKAVSKLTLLAMVHFFIFFLISLSFSLFEFDLKVKIQIESNRPP